MASIPTGTTRAASAVWNAKDIILRRWEDRVRAGTLGQPRSADLALQALLPSFLDSLAEALVVGDRDFHIPSSLTTSGAQVSLGGAALSDVVLEWGILREVLLEVLEAERPLPAEGRLVLHRFVDEGIRSAAAEFSRVHAAETAEARRLQHAVEHAPVFMAVLNRNGTVLDANELAIRAAGTSRSTELGRPFWTTTWFTGLPGAASRARESVRLAIQGQTVRYDAHFWSKLSGPGETRWGDFTFRPVTGGDGQVSSVVVSGIDVTERYRLLEETQLRAVTRYGSAFFAVVDQRLDVSFVNDAGRALLGLPPWDGEHRPSFPSFLRDEDADRLLKEVIPALDGGDRWEGELQFRHADGGSPVEMLCCIFAVRDPVTHYSQSYAVVGHDLRERKRTAYALALERKNFEHLFQESPHLVATLRGPDHVLESVNPAYVRLLRRDATGERFRQAQPEAEPSGIFEMLDRVYATGETICSREHPIAVPGRLGYFNFILGARQDWEGRTVGVTLLATDITEVVRARKSAESAQRELRDFIAQFPSPMCLLHGSDLVFTLANDAFTKLFAEDRMLLGKPLREALPELASPCQLELAESVFRTGEPLTLVERAVTVRSADGSEEVRYVDLLLHPKRNDRGTVCGVIASFSDVTEQVLARRKAQENEARFRHLAEMLPQIIWEVRPDGVLTYCNAYWESFSGLEGTANWRKWEDVIAPNQLEQVWALWVDARKRSEPFEMEVQLRRASDGAYRWFLMRGSPVRDANGAVSKWLAAAMDIHAQKESSAWSDAMVDALPNPLWLIEPETGRILYKSRVASELESHMVPVNVAPEDWEKVYPLTDEDDRPLHFTQYPAYLAARGDYKQKEAVWHSPTRRISFLSRAALVPACFGRPAIVAFMIQDVSDLKNSERELRTALAARDQFLSIASHELKTPLTSLRLLTQSARRRFSPGRDAVPPERLATFVEQTDRGVHRLMRLVDDMLDASRISSGKLTYQVERIDLGRLVDDVVERLSPEAEGVGVSITVEREAGVEGVWDRLRIDQVLTNLLTNALRYGRSSPVSVSVRREDNVAVLEVADRGPGIPEDFREKVFQRFERLPGEDSVPGLGLGLFICREIVEHFDGTIGVESPEGRGARFRVRLPLSPVSDSTSPSV